MVVDPLPSDYLMPVAAVLVIYTLVGILRSVYILYKRQTTSNTRLGKPAVPVVWMGSTLLASLLYTYLVAKIQASYEKIEYLKFNPWDILQIAASETNKTVIQQAYRSQLTTVHPDRGGDERQLQLVQWAYRTLTEETAKRNYEQHGHPNGPFTYPTFRFLLPTWLVLPPLPVRWVMAAVYIIAVAVVVAYMYLAKKSKTTKPSKPINDIDSTISVSIEDMLYLTRVLSPKSTHKDVLYAAISTPEMVQIATQNYEKVQEIRKLRQSQREKTQKTEFDDIMQEGGWDDEDEDDPAAEARRKAEQQRQIEQARLKQIMGQSVELCEGIDEGVLGQQWVEQTLKKNGLWPPKLTPVIDKTFEYNGKQVHALDHPGLRRSICMITGRLHSQMLNSHPELLQAGIKQLVDQTYFKGSMEFRGRVGIMLEACLRLSLSLRSYTLMSTIIEAVAMFKIGCTNYEETEWFDAMMQKQYGTLPRLTITDPSVETPNEAEIATSDKSVLSVELERPFAEQFLKAKIALCEKQGIPPQVALQTYREGWWFLLYAEALDGPNEESESSSDNFIVPKMAAEDVRKFESDDRRILTAWPLIVQNVAQKQGKLKIHFPAPSKPGKYRFHVSVKSQDFLGADEKFSVDAEVVDAAKLNRKVKDDGEDKKDK